MGSDLDWLVRSRRKPVSQRYARDPRFTVVLDLLEGGVVDRPIVQHGHLRLPEAKNADRLPTMAES
jgi:hypothetical protein